MRHIDRVASKGGNTPFDLYTIDLSVENLLKVYGVGNKKEMNPHERQRIKVNNNRTRQLRLSKIEKQRFTSKLWNEDKDIKCMREPYTKIFFG